MSLFLLSLLLLLPFAAAATAFLLRRGILPRLILFCTAALEFLAAAKLFHLLMSSEAPAKTVFELNSMLGADLYSVFFLLVTNLLFLLVAGHACLWLRADLLAKNNPHAKDWRMPEFIFIPCLLCFLGTMTLVICARNFGLLWVAVEATTLASAPLICFNRSGHSLEAMWKYLLICSVGIGFALFGTMLLSLAGHFSGAENNLRDLSFASIAEANLHPGWFKAAFIFILAGYGTKMGLAPFHTWLPDAHSESPAMVSALLSGTLLNCAFLGIVRVMNFAPELLRGFCSDLLIAFGLFSVLTSALFIIRQTDFKRMLAYSSVEHMGLIAIAWGMGVNQAAFIHIFGHTLSKGMLFLLAGNILMAYGTRSIQSVDGMFRKIPRNAMLWILGLGAICGTPPSPLFSSEFMILRGAFFSGRAWIGFTLSALLFAVFAGMSAAFLKMLSGKGTHSPKDAIVLQDCALAEKLVWSPLFLFGLILCSGLVFIVQLMKGAF